MTLYFLRARAASSSNTFLSGRHAEKANGADILVFSFLDFAVCLEIDYRPAGEFRAALLKSEINHALYERAVVAVGNTNSFSGVALRSQTSARARTLVFDLPIGKKNFADRRSKT